ncbi:MAG: Rrf2 family transcriptional regulator [Candidatus Rokubacteria bacterium]|nr:Rrf2 family transcriptional regulator [Candidatus Rokubacteria bacterium]
MLRFTKQADYGLMAIHYIAFHQEGGAVNTRKIAEEYNIPQELLAKILQRLAKRGLVQGQNGPKGGYILTREPKAISVGEVVRAIEGPINIVSCYKTLDCPQLTRCSVRRPVQKIQTSIEELLDKMTLAEMSA